MTTSKKNQTLLILIVLSIVVIFFPAFFYFGDEAGDSADASLVGGQLDQNGCLGPAGFSWDADLGVCLRVWELTETFDRQAVKAVTNLIGSFPGLTLIDVAETSCETCRLVLLERGAIRVGLFVRDGVVEDRAISPLECAMRDGTVRTKLLEDSICEAGEYVVGAVNEGQATKYCCYSMEVPAI